MWAGWARGECSFWGQSGNGENRVGLHRNGAGQGQMGGGGLMHLL